MGPGDKTTARWDERPTRPLPWRDTFYPLLREQYPWNGTDFSPPEWTRGEPKGSLPNIWRVVKTTRVRRVLSRPLSLWERSPGFGSPRRRGSVSSINVSVIQRVRNYLLED